MNDVAQDEMLTVARSRITNIVEATAMVALGDVDASKLEELLGNRNDELGKVEQMLCTLAADLSEMLQANERYIAQNQKAMAELEDKLRTIERQRLAIADLSTPVIEIWDDVLTLPIVGVVDTKRSVDMTERLLHSIVERQAKCVIIDITGVDIVDTATADHFVKMIRAAGMLGAYCVVSGISPDIAQTLTRIGVDLDGVRTLRNLKDALRHCFVHLRRLQAVSDTKRMRSGSDRSSGS